MNSVVGVPFPNLSLDFMDYTDLDAIFMILGFSFVLRVLEFVCMGKEVQGYRMNGNFI